MPAAMSSPETPRPCTLAHPEAKETYQQNEGRATSSPAPLARAENTRTELAAAAARFAKRRIQNAKGSDYGLVFAA